MQLKLYGYWRSSAVYRLRIALNLKQLRYEYIPVNLKDGEQRDAEFHLRNPQELVPVLAHGERTFRQSMAIIEYLDEAYEGRGYRLIPVESRERARVRALAQVVACEIHPLNNLRVLGELEKRFGATQAIKEEWMRHWMATGLDALEQLLAGNPSTGTFCEGDEPTMADCLLVPQVYNAQRFNLDLEPYPTVRRINEAALAMPEFDQARPENQPDAA
jgi:maleylacetoacetate isomerase